MGYSGPGKAFLRDIFLVNILKKKNVNVFLLFVSLTPFKSRIFLKIFIEICSKENADGRSR